jgi:hypothetical protein
MEVCKFEEQSNVSEEVGAEWDPHVFGQPLGCCKVPACVVILEMFPPHLFLCLFYLRQRQTRGKDSAGLKTGECRFY